MLKVGVIGLGAMGQHHARIYSQLDCKLVGVADINTVRAQEIAGKYHTSYYPDYKDLLDEVDAVNIAVPTTLHYKVAMDFLKSGIHCLIEKPIAVNLEQADEMIKEAEKQKVHLAIGHIERFNPAVIKLKNIIDTGTLGQLLIISTRRVGPSTSRIRDVGIIIDSATHDIGVVKYLLGKEPSHVFSRVGSLKHSKEDHAVIVLDFDRTIACLEVNWFTPQKIRTLVATGSEGIAYLDYINQSLIIHDTHATRTADIVKAEPLKLELEDFLTSITEKKQPAVNGIEGRAILKIALESNHNIYNSWSDNKKILDNILQPAAPPKPRIVAAIPSYNTQETIHDVVTRTKQYADEVIVIDDGSTDDSANIAIAAGAQVHKHGINKGYGETIQSCFKLARRHDADILVVIDGDGQHNPGEVPNLTEPLIKAEADVVVGSRFLVDKQKIPRYRKFGITIINELWNFGHKVHVSDTQSGFRAYNKKIIDDLSLSENGMSISIEILEKVRRKKAKIKEVPITCSYENNNIHLSRKAFFHGVHVALSVVKIRAYYGIQGLMMKEK